MKRIISASMISGMIILLSVPMAQAVKYTTRDRPAANSEKSLSNSTKKTQGNKGHAEEKANKCTLQDQTDIKRFNVTAKRKKRDFDELIEGKDEIKTQKQAEDFAKEYEKISQFYSSELYKAMKKIYTRCGLEIPVSKTQKPFWMTGNGEDDMNVF